MPPPDDHQVCTWAVLLKQKFVKLLWLVRATQWADFAVIGVQLCSTILAIFPCVTLSYKNHDCFLLRINVDYCRPQKRPMIWIWVQLLLEFCLFESQHWFCVPKNCTVLLCLHPLGSGVPCLRLAWEHLENPRKLIVGIKTNGHGEKQHLHI